MGWSTFLICLLTILISWEVPIFLPFSDCFPGVLIYSEAKTFVICMCCEYYIPTAMNSVKKVLGTHRGRNLWIMGVYTSLIGLVVFRMDAQSITHTCRHEDYDIPYFHQYLVFSSFLTIPRLISKHTTYILSLSVSFLLNQ